MLLVLFGISIGTGAISAKVEIPTLYLTTNEEAPVRYEAALIIQQVLEEQLGINVEIRVYPWEQYLYGQLLPQWCDPPYEIPPPPGLVNIGLP